MRKALYAASLWAVGLFLPGLAGCSWMPFFDSGSDAPRQRELSAEERIAQALAASDRPAADPARDASRHTAAVLALANVKTGERVLDIGAGGGYMTWLYSSLAGPTGAVTAQDPPAWARESPSLRSMMTVLRTFRPNVGYDVADFDALPGEPATYDLAAMTLIYHDTVRMGTDRVAMNARIYELLKPGGRLLVVDHAAAGSGGDAAGLHRIDAALVRREVEAAGFRLARESDELEAAGDDLTLSVFDPAIRGRTSQFALLFVKPRK